MIVLVDYSELNVRCPGEPSGRLQSAETSAHDYNSPRVWVGRILRPSPSRPAGSPCCQNKENSGRPSDRNRHAELAQRRSFHDSSLGGECVPWSPCERRGPRPTL